MAGSPSKPTFVAWLAAGLLVATAPLVARAQLEDAGVLPGPLDDSGVITPPPLDSGTLADGAPTTILDVAEAPDAAPPGPVLPNGEPVSIIPSGCTCTTTSAASNPLNPLAPAPLLLLALLGLRRRRH